MNIEKLAKHLKEFTLDEINMIAEYDCKTKLEHLLNSNKIVTAPVAEMLQVPNLVQSDLVFNEQLTEFSVDKYSGALSLIFNVFTVQIARIDSIFCEQFNCIKSNLLVYICIYNS